MFLLFRGQRMASELSASNPDLIESIRRNMRNADDNQSDNNPDESTGIRHGRITCSLVA